MGMQMVQMWDPVISANCQAPAPLLLLPGQGMSHLPPSRPGSGPAGVGDSPHTAPQGTLSFSRVWPQCSRLHWPVQWGWKREETEKLGEVGRAAKQEKWEEGGRWWSTLKSGDLSLYPGGSSLRTPCLTSSSPQYPMSLITTLRPHPFIHPSIHLSIHPSIHLSIHSLNTYL